jgi:SagB-type dehydrogenase family enzyme
MSNRDVDEAWRYHNATKHSTESVRADRHTLDWANQPRPLKVYRNLESMPLPRDLSGSDMPALAAISGASWAPGGSAVPDLESLAYILFLSSGITKRKPYPGGEIAFRAASCTGALYEIDLYVVCQELPRLDAGVYHFDPADFAVRRLRKGDHRGVLVRASADEDAIRHAPATIVCTGTYWRNAWKYQARTYRHFGWDNGTILANMLAAANARGVPARVVCGFIDHAINGLLSLEIEREVAFSMIALGQTAAAAPDPPAVEPLRLETVPVSRSEVDYPLMRRMHAASSLNNEREVVQWREAANAIAAQAAQIEEAGSGRTLQMAGANGGITLRPTNDAGLPHDRLEEVIIRRGSTRQFQRGATWTFEQLSTALVRAMGPLPTDFLGTGSGAADRVSQPLLNDLYLIVHAVDDLPPGAYVLHRGRLTLEQLKEGDFREEAGFLGLEQELPADASVVGFFLTDLRAVLDRLGNRGYRAAQLEAGILGGRLYLAAYAQRLGASGLTFYDDDVVSFFSPHAAGKTTIFCMVLGKSVRARTLRIRSR